MSRRHIFLSMLGTVSLVFAILPWLGLGKYAFVIPGTEISPPRLDLIAETTAPFKQIYDIMVFPIELLSEATPLRDVFCFSGEGVLAVRPFMVSVFWFLIGGISGWIAIRPFALPQTYGFLAHRRQTQESRS